VDKPKVFVGSSEANVEVANAIGDGLQSVAVVDVWKDDLFRPTQNFLQVLLDARSRYDFAVMVWAPDDTTKSQGKSQPAPRDNVVFECGLFMGALGSNHVFVVHDPKTETKIPSDFAGIVFAPYDASRMADNRAAAVRPACDLIRDAMRPSLDLTGEWRQRYTASGDIAPRTLEEDIDVVVFADIVSFKRRNNPDEPAVFTARGKLSENRIRGEWQHEGSTVFGHGAFLVVVNGAADVLYGYSAAYDATGGPVFEAWILSKKTGRTDDDVTAGLEWGAKALKARTVGVWAADVATR
jgi:hypothetical protein